MKKSTIILTVVILVLALAVGGFAYLNRGNIEQKQELQDSKQFYIKQGGQSLATVTMDDIESAGLQDIDAILDTSETEPAPVQFTGVELSKLLSYKNIETTGVTAYEFMALDGYASAVTAEEVAMPDNVYIVVKQDGKWLKNKGEGGMGPYLMIIKSSEFSQRWCKFVEAVNLK